METLDKHEFIFLKQDESFKSKNIMARSKKNTKIQGITTAKSEKKNNQDANRKLRRIVKQKVNSGKTDLPELREVSNVWSFDKDGKRYNPKMTEKDLRK